MTRKTNGTAFSVRTRAMLLGTAATALVATPAVAQDSDQLANAASSQSAIVVTGSRITNPNLEQSSPIQVIGQDEIDYRQATNAEELIGELPGIAPGTNNSVNNGSNGTSTLNLRNIGSTRSLVLLDGTRLVPSTLESQTDLNIIPVALVERVEVITGGASSIYGADAISGVANFVLRRDFEGLEAATTYGVTERGDGERIRGDITLGANFDDGRGNAVLSIGYQKVDGILQGSRTYSQATIHKGNILGSGTTVPTRFNGDQIDKDGEILVPKYNSFNYAPFNYFQTPLERYNIFGSANYEVTPGIEVYTRAMFTNNRVDLQLAPSGLFGDAFALPLNNLFLTDGQVDQICASFATPIAPASCRAARTATGPADPNYLAPDVTINRRLVEQGPRQSNYVTNQFQIWAGVRGELSDTIGYDVYGTYGESQRTVTRRNWGLKSRVEQALNAASATTCVDASNGCFPINLQGGGTAGTNIDPRAIAFFNQPSSSTDSVSLTVVNAALNGTLGESGFFTETPIGFAAGVEYREYKASRVAGVAAGTQDEVLGTGAPSPTYTGGYDVIEGFAEMIVPILEDVPGFYSLQAEGAIRVSDYSNTGTSTTWKAGGSWEPFEGFRFRGIYSVSVRSPNIGELFSPVTTGLTALTTDPCQGTKPTGNAKLTAICIAQGAPSATIGKIPEPSAAQINATSGGNADLDVEEAKSITIGLVATPPQVPGLMLSVDYYKIKVTGAITSPTPGDILTPCFGPKGTRDGSGKDPAACSKIGRNPINGSLNGGGETKGLILQLSNDGVLETSGIDFRVNYTLPVSFGSINWDLNGTWTDKLLFQANANAVNRECVGLFSNNCEPITPEWAFNLRTTVSIDDLFDVSLLWRWLDKVEYEDRPSDDFLPESQVFGAANYFDLTVRSNVSENFTLALSVDNLLDRDPPKTSSFIGSSSYNSGNTYPTTYDVLGRRYTVTGRLRF